MTRLPFNTSAHAFASRFTELNASAATAAMHLLKAHGVTTDQFAKIDASGLSIWQVLTLLESYAGTSIGVILDIASAVATVKADPATSVTTLTALALKDGPQVWQIATAIAALFGVKLPPLPTA